MGRKRPPHALLVPIFKNPYASDALLPLLACAVRWL